MGRFCNYYVSGHNVCFAIVCIFILKLSKLSPQQVLSLIAGQGFVWVYQLTVKALFDYCCCWICKSLIWNC